MSGIQKKRHRSKQSAEQTGTARSTVTKKDTGKVDALLEEIDQILDEQEATRREAERAAFKEKIKTINFIIPGRSVDPCAGVIRVPSFMAETMLRSGYYKESNRDCGDC